MRENYFACVIVSLILVFLTTGPISISDTVDENLVLMNDIANKSKSESFISFTEGVRDWADKAADATSIGEHSRKGIISSAYRSSTKSGGMEIAFANSLNDRVFHGKMSGMVVNIFGYILMFGVFIFLRGLVKVGACRFFIENRIYPSSHAGRILFIYRIKRVLPAAGIVALKVVKLILWGFTIVGFPIKYYSWYLTPYLLAENPNISRKDIFKLSAAIMKGSKRRVFLFELSFLPWFLLSLPTLGILQYLFITPYFDSAKAEVYMRLREEAKSNGIVGAELMNDPYLEAPQGGATQYPEELFSISEHRHWLNIHHETHYTAVNVVLMFFIFSFIGWVYECGLVIIRTGGFVDRGSLYGPWIPIYGVGGVAVLLLLGRFRNRPVLIFFLTMLVCGVIEYAVAWGLETFMHLKYWDYSGYFFNIQGRVCLESLLVFATGGTASIYSISPLFNNLLDRVPLTVKKTACAVLAMSFAADLTYTHFHPHTGKHITFKN